MRVMEQAERDLRDWAANNARRDDLVLAAYRAGISKNRIHILTGIARTTIDRILPKENTMTFTSNDLRDQVRIATDASDGEYDVDAIVDDIIERHGAVPVNSIESEEFWAIVGRHTVDRPGALVQREGTRFGWICQTCGQAEGGFSYAGLAKDSANRHNQEMGHA